LLNLEAAGDVVATDPRAVEDRARPRWRNTTSGSQPTWRAHTPRRSDLSLALPKYEIGEVLGRGAFGVVYAGRHVALQRDVAIKQLWPDLLADDEARHQFGVEARVLGALDHPHVVRVYDYVEGTVYALVLERMRGGTLGDLLRARHPAGPAACTMALAALSGLHHAHQREVLHRDVKPQNLLFDDDGLLKLADFGVATVAHSATSLVTPTESQPGTPAYMAPEQINPELGPVSPASDVWAVGAILYEMLSGQRPFSGDNPLSAALLRRTREEARPLSAIAPEIPEALSDVVARSLARMPAERFKTAVDFAEALEYAADTTFGADVLAARRIPLLPHAAGDATPRASRGDERP
jgi:serine/threonine-protein kinase